ncbi:MAG: hypothetical protein KF851_04310 [Pirellulaceae bacterium]|nr:hypothetical protein [Pirellulaceae bacterium]
MYIRQLKTRQCHSLLELFPEAAFQLASTQLISISEKTEDKEMYDAREKAIRDHEWAIHVARDEGIKEGEIKGKIETIRLLQKLLGLSPSRDSEFVGKSLEELQAITTELQKKFQNRNRNQ